MRLVDWMVRQGHLSEADLTEALLTGDRPRHLDRCARCADRAIDLARWMDDLKAVDVDAADAAFPADRLALQHAQIMRRLEQADEPVRVIEFPRQPARVARETGARRVAPAWVGVGAAAGLVVGVIGGQLAARHEQPALIVTAPAPSSPLASAAAASRNVPPAVDVEPVSASPRAEGASSVLDMDLEEGFTPSTLRAFDEATPRLIPSAYTAVVERQ